MPRAMTAQEQLEHSRNVAVIRSTVSALRLSRLAAESEDIRVALARLENWLVENDNRWTTGR